MVLEAIFRGNFSPAEQAYPTDPEYQKLNLEVCNLCDQLSQELSPANQKILNKLITMIYNAQCIESESCFMLGFAAGMEVQREATKQLECLNVV